MTFEEDLTKRRIDVAAFATGDPTKFSEWQQMYAQMHPNSFYISVKMVLNDVRRKFWLAEAVKPAVSISTEAPAKPAVRRAAIPGAAKPVVETAAPTTPTEQPEQSESKPAAPIRGRAVIRKPAVSNPDAISNPEVTPAVTPEKPVEAPSVGSAPRPRPVFRKLAPTGTSADEPLNPEQIARDNTNQATPFHTNPDPETKEETETPASKPAPRPRPVIKRPLVQTNTEEVNAPVSAPTEVNPMDNMPKTAPETGSEVKATPPRPRPVMRRPSPEAPPPPAATPTEQPTAEKPAEEPAATAKPPRPRPVFKRPSKPEDNSNP